MANSIVILDDNYIIRNILKNEIFKHLYKVYPELLFDIYSSEDGVGGLGYIFITKPNIIIVDTTLPKYSGREIFDFLKTNPIYKIPTTLIILIAEKPLNIPDLPLNFIELDKGNHDFLNKLYKNVIEHLYNNVLKDVKTVFDSNAYNEHKPSLLGKSIIYLSNAVDIVGGKNFLTKPFFLIIFKPLVWFFWVLFEIVIAAIYTVYNLFQGNVLGEATIAVNSQVNFRSPIGHGVLEVFTGIIYTMLKFGAFLMINVLILLISRSL